MIRKILSIISLVIVITGFYGFFTASANAHDQECSEELPLNDLQGIIVTKNAIYIGLGYYSRI